MEFKLNYYSYNLICRPILRGEPLTVRVQGLEYMNDDPSSVDVLYAKIQAGEQAERSGPFSKFHYIPYIIFHGCKLISNLFFYFLGFKYLLID